MSTLTRSSSNKMFAGVLGGIGEHYGVDPTMLRIVYGALMVLTFFGPLALLYLAAVVIIPQE